MLILLIFLILAVFLLTLRYEEFGFVAVIVIPLVKSIFSLPTDTIPMLNLLFLFNIFTVFSIVLKQSFSFESTKLEKHHLITLVIFSALLLFSLIYTNEIMYGSEKVFKFLFFNVVYFVGSMIIFQQPQKIRNFVKIFKYTILIVSILNIIFLIKYFLSGTLLQELVVRFTMSGGDPIGLARVMGLGIIFWVQEIIETKKMRDRVLLFLILIPLIISLIASNTRGPLIFTLLVIFIQIFLFSNMTIQRKVTLIFISIFILFIFVLILPPQFFLRFLYFFDSSTFNTNNSMWSASSSALRMMFINRIKDDIALHPHYLFIGSGAGNFALIADTYKAYGYPHNIFWEIIYEIGLVGLGLFLYAIWLVILDIKNYKLNTNSIAIPMILGFLFILINSQISGDLDNNRVLWIFWGGIIGISIYHSQRNEQTNLKTECEI